MILQLNEKAPEFSLPDQNGKIHSLLDYKGKWILIYFYPKDDTSGCTIEACSFRDNLPKFLKSDLVVLGISADSIVSHKKFVEKHKLTFTLLADEQKQIVTEYGVWQEKNFMGKKYMGISRASFLINPQGKIVKIYEKVNPIKHAQEVLTDFAQLKHTA